jgi:hypothetical protein
MTNTPSEKLDSNDSSDHQPPQKQQQRRSPYRWWIVLPVIVVSMTTTTIVDPVLLNDLMVRRAEYKYNIVNASAPASETACNTENIQNDSAAAALVIEVQKSVSHLNIRMAVVGALPAV